MNLFSRIVFFFMAFALGFVSPVITFGLIILYYLPSIIKSICQEYQQTQSQADTIQQEFYKFEYMKKSNYDREEMKEYSDNTLSEMK